MNRLRFRGSFLNSFRRGSMVIMLVSAITTASFLTANQFANDKITEYRIAKASADGFKAFLLARAGVQGAIGALKTVDEQMLYQSGIAFNPPPIPLAGGTIYYKITPEDGKFNLNSLVRAHDSEPNLRAKEMVTRLFEQLAIPPDKVPPIIDWIDENSEEVGGGAEIFYYSGLTPPRKVKNSFMYSLSELTSVKGFSRELVYESLKPKDYEDTRSQDFATEEEKILINDGDFVLSNNITAFLPFNDQLDTRVNINAAPYYVLMSLSESMSKAAVLNLLKLKIEKGGYIKELGDIEKIPEFQAKTPSGFTLYKELVGEGTAVSAGKIKVKGEIYRIVGVGQIGTTVRRVSILFDFANDQVIYYSED